MERKTVQALSHNWTSTQRSNVATLCAHIVYESVWSNKDVDLEWKQQFLADLFQHLAVDNTKDIRQEIISEILLVCLGLTRSEISNSNEGLHLKEKVNDLVSNGNNVDTQLTDSIVLVNKPVEYDARSRAVLFKHAQYLNVSITDVKSLER
ncbi:8797_t:CDS:2, partial [Racocetra persica]